MSDSLREMVIKARENDDMMVQILKDFEPLMKKCIKIYVKDFLYFDDAIQESRLTVLQCIKRYDINSPISFAGYVKRAVVYSVRDFGDRIKLNLSLDEEINEDGGTLHDILEGDMDIEGDEVNKEERIELKKAYERLPENYRNILQKFYFEKMSLREICNNRRCHYMTVVKLKERALKYLREELEYILPDYDK